MSATALVESIDRTFTAPHPGDAFLQGSFESPDLGVGHRSGGATLLGAQRYGAITWEDASRHRLSVFCRAEAAVIVEYLRHRRDRDELSLDTPRIDAALERFWVERSETAPTRAELEQ